MRPAVFKTKTSEGALVWLLDRKMIVKSSTKDPETLAVVRGYILSDGMRERIGSNLVNLFARVTEKRNGGLRNVSLRDALLAATIGAVLELGQTSLSEDEMMRCANIILALLPIERFEEAGIAAKTLRSLSHDRFLVGKIRRIVGWRGNFHSR